MMKAYDAEFTPWNPDDGSSSPIENSLIGNATTRFSGQLRRLAAYYTGTEDGIHSREREQELFTQIRDGNLGQQAIIAIEHTRQMGSALDPDTDNRLERSLSEANEAIVLGRRALQEIIEVNARFARHLARISIGMTPMYRWQTLRRMNTPLDRLSPAAREETTDLRQFLRRGKGALSAHRSSLTALASPYAVLDDRIQMALVGLMLAAKAFQPDYIDVTAPDKAPPRFTSYAAVAIRNTIEILMSHSTSMETSGPRLPQGYSKELSALRRKYSSAADLLDIVDQIAANDDLPPEALAHYLQWEEAQYTIPLDEVRYPHAASEEADDWVEAPILGIADVHDDPDEPTLFHQAIMDVGIVTNGINEVLSTLSEREADIIRLHFGLKDGKRYTNAEIANVYGITVGRVNSIFTKVMEVKLRHPSREEKLRALFDIIEDDGIANHFHLADKTLRIGRGVASRAKRHYGEQGSRFAPSSSTLPH